jgi:hypothetical protein
LRKAEAVKTLALICLALAACVDTGATPLEVAHLDPAPTAAAIPPHVTPAPSRDLVACPFVCPGEEVAPYGDHLRCSGGEECAAEPDCATAWTLADRLECDPIRTADGTAFIGRSNNCIVERIGGTLTACTMAPMPECATTCDAGGVVTCTVTSCWCTTPSGGAFDCWGAASCDASEPPIGGGS